MATFAITILGALDCGTPTTPAVAAHVPGAILSGAGGSPSTPRHAPPTNATSVNTPDWVCIRLHESTDGRGSPNLYQFQGSLFRQITGLTGPPGSYPRSIQDRAALGAYALWYRADGVGFHPWRADRRVCHLPW